MARTKRVSASRFDGLQSPEPPPLPIPVEARTVLEDLPGTALRGRKLRKAKEHVQGGLYRCLVSVLRHGSHYQLGEVVEFTSEEAFPLVQQGAVERVELDDEGEVRALPKPRVARAQAPRRS